MARASAALVWIAVALFALICVGCGTPLPGVDDAEVVLEHDDKSVTPETLKKAIGARLAAVRVAADVDVDGTRATLRADADTLLVAREVLRWTGGITVWAEVQNDRPFEGAPHRVDTFTKDPPPPPGVRYFSETRGPDYARLRAAKSEPVIEIAHASISDVDVDESGRRLRFVLDAPAAASFERAASAVPGALFAVRDQTVLGTIESRNGVTFTVSAGEGLFAYTRADRLRTLLKTPAVPALEPKGARALPFAPATFIAGLALPFLLSFAWLWFVRRFDRLHPEPLWLVGLVFFFGVLSVVPAALLEIGWIRMSIVLNPTFATMGGRISALPYALAVFTLVVGMSEEGVKLAAAMFVRKRREFDEPIDGIVYGVAAALGFAAAENVKYFAVGRLAPSLIVARTFTSIPAHFFLGAIWGYALGQTLVPGRPRTIVLRAFGLAAFLHGAFDALLSTRGLAPFALLLNLGLASAFVVLVRRALRRGALDADRAPLSTDRHTVLRVGSGKVFALGATGVHVGALGAVILGVLYENAGARPGVGFFVAAGAALAVLLVSAWAISAALPLDVVIDADGVTFAGSLRRWALIERVSRHESGLLHYLDITSSEGELRIGPVASREMATLDALIASHLPAR